MPGVLTDEHVPGRFIAVLRTLGYDVVRAKDLLEEGADDQALLAMGRHERRVVVTGDRRFTVVEDTVMTDHAGVIYADQGTLQHRPEDAAAAVDRILTVFPPTELEGTELYLQAWLEGE